MKYSCCKETKSACSTVTRAPVQKSRLGRRLSKSAFVLCRSHPWRPRWHANSWQSYGYGCCCSRAEPSLCPCAWATCAIGGPRTAASARTESLRAERPGHNGGWHAAAAGSKPVALHRPGTGRSDICIGGGNACHPGRANQDPGDIPGKHGSPVHDQIAVRTPRLVLKALQSSQQAHACRETRASLSLCMTVHVSYRWRCGEVLVRFLACRRLLPGPAASSRPPPSSTHTSRRRPQM